MVPVCPAFRRLELAITAVQPQVAFIFSIIVDSPADLLKLIQDIMLSFFDFQNPLFDLLKIALFGNLIHKDT
jgi:hypothetical protein